MNQMRLQQVCETLICVFNLCGVSIARALDLSFSMTAVSSSAHWMLHVNVEFFLLLVTIEIYNIMQVITARLPRILWFLLLPWLFLMNNTRSLPSARQQGMRGTWGILKVTPWVYIGTTVKQDWNASSSFLVVVDTRSTTRNLFFPSLTIRVNF